MKSDKISFFGHDIEATKAVGNEALLKEIKTITLKIVETTLTEGFDQDTALFNEANPHGLTETAKHLFFFNGFLSTYFFDFTKHTSYNNRLFPDILPSPTPRT